MVNFQDLRIENRRRGGLGSDISTANSLSDASKAIGALTGLYYGLSNNSILGQSNIGKVVVRGAHAHGSMSFRKLIWRL